MLGLRWGGRETGAAVPSNDVDDIGDGEGKADYTVLSGAAGFS